MYGKRSILSRGQLHSQIHEKIEGSKNLTSFYVHPELEMQWFLNDTDVCHMIKGRTLSLPIYKDIQIPFIHVNDISMAILKILHPNIQQRLFNKSLPKTCILRSEEFYSMDDIANLFSEFIQPPLRYSYFPMWAVQPSMWIKGYTPEDIRDRIQFSTFINSSYSEKKYEKFNLDKSSAIMNVKDITMQDQYTLSSFIKDNYHTFAYSGFK